MPGKWGGARRARPPLDPPMHRHVDYNRTTELGAWAPMGGVEFGNHRWLAT